MNVGMHQCSIVRKVCTGLVCMLLKMTICRDLGSVVAVAVSRLLCLSNNLKWDRFGAGLVAAVPRMSFPFSLFLVIPQVVFGHILGGGTRTDLLVVQPTSHHGSLVVVVLCWLCLYAGIWQ